MSLLSQFPAYALLHPTQVDLAWQQRCFLSGRPFPARLGHYNPGGHLEVWELIVPLPGPDIAIWLDERLHIFAVEPYLRLFFYSEALKQMTAADAARLTVAWQRAIALQALALQSKKELL